MKEKNYLIAVCISVVIALAFSPMSGSQTIEPYDPWVDYDDDGDIDLYDAVLLLSRYGTKGSPVNKTALLYNVNETLTELLLKIDSLNATVFELQSRILELETQIAILNATKLGKPDYDSFEEYRGWKYIPPDGYWIFEHQLNTINVLVYLIFYDPTTGNINHHFYGSDRSSISGWVGAWWSDLTNTTITVHRYAESDECAYVRVMIWKIPE